MKPAVIHLPLHLENYQPLTFKRKSTLVNILSNSGQRKTMLTELFVENDIGVLAKKLKLTYNQFPDHFVWKGDKKMWSPRKIGDSIGRIVIAHPTEGEREAALLRGYLLDDATQQSMGRRLHQFDVLPQNSFDRLMEDDTRGIKTEKNIVVSTEDLAAIYTLNKEQKAQYEDLLHSLTPNEISYGEFAGKEVAVDLCNYKMHGISLLFNEKGCNLLTWYRNHTPLEQYSIRK
ncbi:unnamed protein product [Lactuca saligna]|uniref:Uncharacterized protein n=1 Tax=Lactuca saligna TaxID=75948 RepID=A0AA35UMW3_LACSI|nr:unnamed protein product [Lactuca saligna]